MEPVDSSSLCLAGAAGTHAHPRQRANDALTHSARCVHTACAVTVFGASGDLAKKKTLPALYALFSSGALGFAPAVLGVARSALSHDAWRAQLRPHLPPDGDAATAQARACAGRASASAAAARLCERVGRARRCS
jgi:hypothetical protein